MSIRISSRIFVKGGGGGEEYSQMLFHYYRLLKLGGSGGMLPQENFFQSLKLSGGLIFRVGGEACCLYTVASVNRSVKSMYTLPQGTFWTFRHTLFT